MIYGERIRQARELQGLKQSELAEKVGVNQSAIARIENDTLFPSIELLEAIADQTGFLPAFFAEEPIQDFPLGTLSFRSYSLTAKEESKVHQYSKLLYGHIKKMIKELRLPPNRLSQLDSSENPSKAARIVRNSLGLSPDMPIRNLIRTLEKNGVIIIMLPLLLPKVDAFSLWRELDCDRPLIAIPVGKPMDRLRFSISHEIGHLVLHHGAIKGTLKDAEKTANVFASEFLMPEAAMRRDLISPITLTSVARLKPKWGAAMQALIYRARDLDIITERQFRYLFQQLSARGWRKQEPKELDLPAEKPEIVKKMAETLFDDIGQYADAMNMRMDTAMGLFMFF